MKLSLLFLVVALIAAIFGFSGIAEASADIGVILFVVFGVLFLISLVFSGGHRTAGGFLGGVGGVALMAAVVLGAVWFSDRYSLESAGAELDQTLADARESLDEVVDDLPNAIGDAGDEVEQTLDDVGEAFDPKNPERVRSSQGAE